VKKASSSRRGHFQRPFCQLFFWSKTKTPPEGHHWFGGRLRQGWKVVTGLADDFRRLGKVVLFLADGF
jgi:hypothetical protein